MARPTRDARSREALELAIAGRIDSLTSALGHPWTDAFATYEDALSLRPAGDARAGRRPSTPFLERADAFLHASAIALSIVETSSVRSDYDKQAHRAMSKFAVESIRGAHVRTVSGLRDLEVALLTEWNESSGPETDEFWRQIRAAGLPFLRRDILQEVLQRGRITSREQYEFVVDSIVVLEQEGIIDQAQAERLSRMIGEYEARGAG